MSLLIGLEDTFESWPDEGFKLKGGLAVIKLKLELLKKELARKKQKLENYDRHRNYKDHMRQKIIEQSRLYLGTGEDMQASSVASDNGAFVQFNTSTNSEQDTIGSPRKCFVSFQLTPANFSDVKTDEATCRSVEFVASDAETNSKSQECCFHHSGPVASLLSSHQQPLLGIDFSDNALQNEKQSLGCNSLSMISGVDLRSELVHSPVSKIQNIDNRMKTNKSKSGSGDIFSDKEFIFANIALDVSYSAIISKVAEKGDEAETGKSTALENSVCIPSHSSVVDAVSRFDRNELPNVNHAMVNDGVAAAVNARQMDEFAFKPNSFHIGNPGNVEIDVIKSSGSRIGRDVKNMGCDSIPLKKPRIDKTDGSSESHSLICCSVGLREISPEDYGDEDLCSRVKTRRHPSAAVDSPPADKFISSELESTAAFSIVDSNCANELDEGRALSALHRLTCSTLTTVDVRRSTASSEGTSSLAPQQLTFISKDTVIQGLNNSNWNIQVQHVDKIQPLGGDVVLAAAPWSSMVDDAVDGMVCRQGNSILSYSKVTETNNWEKPDQWTLHSGLSLVSASILYKSSDECRLLTVVRSSQETRLDIVTIDRQHHRPQQLLTLDRFTKGLSKTQFHVCSLNPQNFCMATLCSDERNKWKIKLYSLDDLDDVAVHYPSGECIRQLLGITAISRENCFCAFSVSELFIWHFGKGSMLTKAALNQSFSLCPLVYHENGLLFLPCLRNENMAGSLVAFNPMTAESCILQKYESSRTTTRSSFCFECAGVDEDLLFAITDCGTLFVWSLLSGVEIAKSCSGVRIQSATFIRRRMLAMATDNAVIVATFHLKDFAD